MVGKAAAITAALLAASFAGAAGPGESAFPGANGRIVFQRGEATDGGQSSLYVVNPDGSGLVRLDALDGGPGRDTASVDRKGDRTVRVERRIKG